MRLAILFALFAAIVQANARDLAPQTSEPLIVDVDRVPDEVISIWPAEAPGGERVHLNEHFEARTNPFDLPDRVVKEITRPTLSIFRAAHPDGSAILIAPGGGFAHVVVEKEGWECARWFSRHGATVYVMTYRLPQEGWGAGPDTPLQDAQRAMRVIRARATRFEALVYRSIDATDALSARPDAVVLVYPVATMREPHAHAGSRDNLIGKSPAPDRVAKYSLETNPPAGTPPVFLLHAGDDTSVPVENSVALYTALKKAGVPVVLHIFEHGGHGFGLRGLEDNPVRVWPQLVLDFGVAHGVFLSRAAR
jgi:acetyl esterase/lipase